jgi:hypothetical protein
MKIKRGVGEEDSAKTVSVRKEKKKKMLFASRYLSRPLMSQRSALKLTSIRHKSTVPVFSYENLKELFPKINLSGSTTLGEVWEKAYTKYPYKLAYPIILWAGFVSYYFNVE